MKKPFISLKIVGFDNYVPRKDIKSGKFFSFHCDFFEQKNVWNLSNDEKIMLVYLFTLRCSKNKIYLNYNAQVAGAMLNMSIKEVEIIFESMRQKGYIVEVSDDEIEQVESQIEESQKGSAEKQSAFAKYLQDLWNSECDGLAKCRTITEKRLSGINRCFNENDDFEYWKEVLEKMKRSDFLMGRNSESSFVASFDFLIKEDVHLKISEGKYDNPKNKPKKSKIIDVEPTDHELEESEQFAFKPE